MGSGLRAKKNQCDMGTYVYKPQEYEAMRWCVANNIKISPKAHTLSSWFIEINLNGKTTVSPDAYKKVEIWKQIFKYYKYYYEKYNK
jgi:hypothetical protein